MKTHRYRLLVVLFVFTMGFQGLYTEVECTQEFKGKIAKKYEDSQEWWPKAVRPHPDVRD